MVYPWGGESLAYIQLRVYSTRLDVAKSYHDGIATLALSIRVTAYTHPHTTPQVAATNREQHE